MNIDPQLQLAPAPEVFFREVSGEMVLVQLEKGVYFGLDEVGTRVWSLLAEGLALGEIRERLLAEYEVEPETLWRDLIELVSELARHELVEPAAMRQV